MSDTSILDHPLISERYFFPRPGSLSDPFWVDCGDAKLACYRESPHADARTLIYFHGNGEIVADYVPAFTDLLLSLGLNLLMVEYRGYGDSTGTPGVACMLGDVVPIFESLELPANRIVVYGRSVGSIYAVEFARHVPGIAGLILESGIADPLERILVRVQAEELGVTEEQLAAAASEHLDSQRKLGAFLGPLLVLHAEYDGLVDVSHAQRNHDWAAGSNKTLLIFPQGDHNSVVMCNLDAYLEALRTFLDGLERN